MNGNTSASGKKRLISINSPAKIPNHKAAKTGAVERYVLTSCIMKSPIFFFKNFLLKLIELMDHSISYTVFNYSLIRQIL